MNQCINNINVNDEISWCGGSNHDHLMSGKVVERVRAKTRPRLHQSPSFAEQKTSKCVSFIVSRSKKLFWVLAEQVVTGKVDEPVPVAKNIAREVVDAAEPARENGDYTAFKGFVPLPFQGKFSALMTYLR